MAGAGRPHAERPGGDAQHDGTQLRRWLSRAAARCRLPIDAADFDAFEQLLGRIQDAYSREDERITRPVDHA